MTSMNSQSELPAEGSLTDQPHGKSGWSLRLNAGRVILLLVLDLVLLGVLACPLSQVRLLFAPTTTASQTSSPITLTPSPTSSATPQPSPTLVTPTPSPVSSPPFPAGSSPEVSFPNQGTVILAIDEGTNTHLFAYHPLKLPLTRLTNDPWDDIAPALSPDGSRVAFASNRNGYWDLYILDFTSSETTRLTDSLEYDSAPSWSPDGQWIVHETYDEEGGLDLYVRSVDGTQPVVRLTNNPGADHSPAWSPQGRKVAFVSTRSGESEIWLADLDKPDPDRFINLSKSPSSHESHPVWSPDGTYLAWASVKDGIHDIVTLEDGKTGEEVNGVAHEPQTVGNGDWPAWSPDGKTLLSLLLAPNQAYLTAYDRGMPQLLMPPVKLPGSVEGLVWANKEIDFMHLAAIQQAAQVTATPLWSPALTPVAGMPGNRYQVVSLENVEAPYPRLHDLVDESFNALRTQLAAEIGWDVFASLDNAFIPLTSFLEPGMGEDWLYTGRAYALTPLPLNAGWMAVVREDYYPHTYWRVYLRAFYQDGSTGRPLYYQPWDFNARYSGDTVAYENGGVLAKDITSGYWLDFTQRAADYGWERLPALVAWQSSFPSARFNEFVLPGGLDWRSAMLEIYPPEVLVTPTQYVPPTLTPTRTSRWYQTPTSTPTATPRPTLTPANGTGTPTPTGTR